jgi:glucose-1-phosphate cytidylyltransferase
MTELTAVLLCGGKGERLRPFTELYPKPLVPLRGKPLLHHLLTYLSLVGVRRYVVCVGYKAERIEEFLRESARPDWNVITVNSGDASMTDRLLDARPHVPGQALICYGDTLANVSLSALQRQCGNSDALMTMTVYPLYSPFGIVNINREGQVTSFAEKPRLPHFINIGFMLCEPAALDFLERGSDMPDFLSALVHAGRLDAYRHEGKHLTVNTERDRSVAEAEIVEFYTVLSDQSVTVPGDLYDSDQRNGRLQPVTVPGEQSATVLSDRSL